MVTRSPSQQLKRITVHYNASASLTGILNAVFGAGAEPSWQFARLSSRRCFRLVADIPDRAEPGMQMLAAIIQAIPTVQSVTFKDIASSIKDAGLQKAPVISHGRL